MVALSKEQKEELRSRVARLIDGNLSVNDLSRVFLGIRTRTGDAEVVQEIADFVAHPDRRDTGFSTSLVRNTFKLMRFKIRYLNQRIDFNSLPADFADVLRSAYALVSQHLIKKDTGFKRSKVKALYRKLIRNLVPKDDGTFRYEILSADEGKLLKSLVSYIVVSDGFNGNRLTTEFVRVLLLNDLIDPSQRRQVQNLSAFLSMFAVVHMHHCRIELGQDDFAVLKARPNNGNIEVLAETLVATGDGNQVTTAVPLFFTDLPVIRWCTERLIQEIELWDRPLEISNEVKLSVL